MMEIRTISGPHVKLPASDCASFLNQASRSAVRSSGSHGEEDSDHRSGRSGLRPITQETTMPSAYLSAPEAPTAIQTHLAASQFVSFELSIVYPVDHIAVAGLRRENVGIISVRVWDVAALLARFSSSSGRRRSGPGKSFPIVVIFHEVGLDGFWFGGAA